MPAVRRQGFDLNQSLSQNPSRRSHGLGSARVEQADPAADNNEHLFALEPGQCQAHRFDRQPQIVRDVLPAHRQRDGLPLVADMGQARPPPDEKRRDLLFRRSPPQQKHLLLGQHQLARREFVDPQQEMRTVFNKLREGVRGEAAYRNSVDRIAEKL
jgi:hypothetical protein